MNRRGIGGYSSESQQIMKDFFDKLLAKHRIENFDVVKIDAEGHDFQIFKQIDLQKYNSSLVRLEWINLDENERKKIKRIFENYGYTYEFSGQDITALNSKIFRRLYTDFEETCLPLFKHCIDIAPDRVPLDDYNFWCVVFKDSQGNDLFRQDADRDEIARMQSDPDGYCKIWRQFNTEIQPKSWVVWPYSQKQGWCMPIIGSLQ